MVLQLRILLFSLISIAFTVANAQNGILRGRIFDEINGESVAGASVLIQGTQTGAITDSAGFYEIGGLIPGVYNITVSFIGYETQTIFEIQVSNGFPAVVDVSLTVSAKMLESVEIKSGAFTRSVESPVSLTSIGANEIRRSPGGNRDISKVIQLLPGVSSGLSYRNDLLVRGGAPNENRFYLDDIEVPTINHFTTQGASGGSNGLINVDFIQKADFYSGAFPSAKGNTLSSILELTQQEGRTDRLGFTATIGASDAGITLQGPLKSRSNFLFSVRRSYLQLLFKALKLPFLPTYNDAQVKTTHKFNSKHDLTFIGLGAYDDFKLNLDLEDTEENLYLLGTLPYFKQWNYTVGARYRYFRDRSYLVFVLSRNMLGNKIFKDLDNDDTNPANRIFDLQSTEAENKFRFEHVARLNGYKISYGVNYEYSHYTNETVNKVVQDSGVYDLLYSTDLPLHKYGFHFQVSRSYLDEKLSLSIGARADGSNYNSRMANPFRQFSPRFSASYAITRKLSVNFNTGWYHQLPPYTVLGYKDTAGNMLNRDRLEYISNAQLIGGLSYTTGFNARFSAEAFYKRYYRYPMLVEKGISLANLGGDFGVVGDEPAESASEGKAYGLELAVQQKLYKGIYGLMTYTFYRSMFTDTSGKYASSSWDNRHVFNLTFGYKMQRNWEIGVKWRLLGGKPYTPDDELISSLKEVWDVKGQGIPAYSQLNTVRTAAAHQLDLRVDKKWFFERWSLDLYLDIVNLYNFKVKDKPSLTVVRDANGTPVTDPVDPARYLMKYLDNKSGNIIPSIGFVVEY